MVGKARRVLLTLFVVVGGMAALGRAIWHTGVFDDPPEPAATAARPLASGDVAIPGPGSGTRGGEAVPLPASAPGSGRTAPVLQIYDGDTIQVRIDGEEERVRLIGVDTPEAPRDDRPGHPGYQEATKMARELIGEGPVTLVKDPQSRNRGYYDRLLRHVAVGDGRYLSDALIESGLGFALVRYPHSRIARVVSLEERARVDGRGLWSPDRVEQVSWRVAPEHLGEVVTVQGKIVDTHNTGKICFLNFHENYRDHITAVIFRPSFGLFPEPPEHHYRGKNVKVLGRITEYRGRPQIRVRAPDQITIVD
jgi:micrococcal nuclease